MFTLYRVTFQVAAKRFPVWSFFVSRRAYTAEVQCACTVAHSFETHLTRTPDH